MRGIIVLMLLLSPSLVFAHGLPPTSGFGVGLMHPVLGMPHLLAMVSVGILSAQIGGRAIWTAPSTFVFMMVVGGILGINNIFLLHFELGIAISVLVLGIALAAKKQMPLFLSFSIVSFFAIFHGHAHGTGILHLISPVFYISGFITGTAAIHLAGVAIGLVMKKIPNGVVLLRFGGAFIAGIGFTLCFQLRFLIF